MKGLLASGLLASFALIAGCGGSGTSSSGSFSCNGGSVQLGPGLTCDESTSPPTIKIVYGSGAGTVAEGNDGRFGGIGKFLGTFVPTTTQSVPATTSAPGGLAVGHNGGLVYNQATGRIGVRAANEICAAVVDWPGHSAAIPAAHACTNEELISNAHAGNIPENATGMAFGLLPNAYSSTLDTNPLDSYKGTCGDWTYDSADRHVGTTWKVQAYDTKNVVSGAFDKAPAINFIVGASCGGSSTAGSVYYPIACCD